MKLQQTIELYYTAWKKWSQHRAPFFSCIFITSPDPLSHGYTLSSVIGRRCLEKFVCSTHRTNPCRSQRTSKKIRKEYHTTAEVKVAADDLHSPVPEPTHLCTGRSSHHFRSDR